ncbi:MAG: ABC transporter ATP-binding protein [bacterium]|jgi:putative ABC transport system ATP-binding protein|nr:ABC transporter ATP-binding protein [candidate division KSB1 bacterium]MDH7559069.1 ABC transporter ATP-binding protein [bacterium]
MESESIVVLKRVCRFYRMGQAVVKAVDCVSMEVRRGEFVAVVGSSGSGKTTLLNLIAGLDRPTSGQIIVGGRDLALLPERALAEHRKRVVGMVFQAFNLIPAFTAEENVALPLIFAGAPPLPRRQRARELLGALGLGERLHHRPGELSGGELQRTAMARALANGPELLLADEPTGNLDSSTAAEIINLLADLHRSEGKTVILVTHDEPMARRVAQRIVRLSYGRIVGEELLL